MIAAAWLGASSSILAKKDEKAAETPRARAMAHHTSTATGEQRDCATPTRHAAVTTEPGKGVEALEREDRHKGEA